MLSKAFLGLALAASTRHVSPTRGAGARDGDWRLHTLAPPSVPRRTGAPPLPHRAALGLESEEGEEGEEDRWGGVPSYAGLFQQQRHRLGGRGETFSDAGEEDEDAAVVIDVLGNLRLESPRRTGSSVPE